MNKVTILGASGQLGQAITKQLTEKKYDLNLVTHDNFEAAADFDKLEQFKDSDIIINCIAFHDVSRCESEFALSMKINGDFVKQLAGLCEKNKIVLIHFSTDYIFNGQKKEPYSEDDIPAPVNVYGVSKLAGEMFVKAYCRKHYLMRVASLFGHKKDNPEKVNFVEKMINAANEKMPIKVINDQIMSPTYSTDVARAVTALLDKKADYGLYHATNSGSVSWYDFALAIFQLTGQKADISPISFSEYHADVSRPQYCSMDNSKIIPYYAMPPWKEALADYLRVKGYIK